MLVQALDLSEIEWEKEEIKVLICLKCFLLKDVWKAKNNNNKNTENKFKNIFLINKNKLQSNKKIIDLGLQWAQ